MCCFSKHTCRDIQLNRYWNHMLLLRSKWYNMDDGSFLKSDAKCPRYGHLVPMIWRPCSHSSDCAVDYQSPTQTLAEPITNTLSWRHTHFISIALNQLKLNLNTWAYISMIRTTWKPYLKIFIRSVIWFFLVWLMSHLFTRRGWCLWPILEPATGGTIKKY